MRIGLKLTAAFLGIAMLVAAAGYLAQGTGHELKQQMERLSQNAIRRTAAVREITITLYARQLAAHEQIAAARRRGNESGSRSGNPMGNTAQRTSGDPEDVAVPSIADLSALAQSLAQTSPGPLQQQLVRYEELMNRFLELLDDDVDAAEEFLDSEVRRHFEDELLPQLMAIREQAERASTGGIRGVERALAIADQRRGLLLVATAAVAISVGLFLSRSIGKSLGTLQEAAREIGRGSLDTQVAIRGRDEIGTLAASLNQMAAQLREKTVSKDHVDNIIHSMREMLIVADADLRIREVNPAVCSELGYTAADLIDRPLPDLFAEEGRGLAGDVPAASGRESSMQTRSGERIPVHFSTAELRDATGGLTGVVCVALNVSRQKDTENRLRASLREKDLLLKEVHHRVKNNLQVISSLLSLQAQEIRDPEMVRLFQESQARVRSMALIHELLYRSDDLAHVDFATYVEQLVGHLKQGFGNVAACVSFRLDVQPVPILLDLAIPCGMIVNELVANAMEHAFPEGSSGEIRIAFDEQEGQYRLTVSDDGPGMRGGPDSDGTTSIGLKVVQALTRQIHGRLEHDIEEGTTFTIQFPNPEQRRPAAARPS
jgi:PAS domain S-box-containing protein